MVFNGFLISFLSTDRMLYPPQHQCHKHSPNHLIYRCPLTNISRDGWRVTQALQAVLSLVKVLNCPEAVLSILPMRTVTQIPKGPGGAMGRSDGLMLVKDSASTTPDEEQSVSRRICSSSAPYRCLPNPNARMRSLLSPACPTQTSE